MRGNIVSFRILVLFGLFFALMMGQGCGCDDATARDDPMEIKIVSPRGTLITAGTAGATIKDFNGIVTAIVLIDGKEILKKEIDSKPEYTVRAVFDLEAMPDSFKITFTGIDSTGEELSKSITVRKDQGAPQVRFKLPVKLDEKHSKLFVGKTFKVNAEARDRDGIAEIVVSLATNAKDEQTVRTCAVNKKTDVWEKCESDLNLSDAKYKDGDMVLQATATDQKGKKPDRKVRLQITLDKTGPQIQFKTPNADQRLKGGEEFRAIVRDQVGVKKVQLWVGTQQLNNVKVDKTKDEYYALIDKSLLNGSNPELKVTACDNLDNCSELIRKVRGGCTRDADCDPGLRCCVANSPVNKDGSKTGRCFKVQDKEGALCDPCTNPCGKGNDGKLMGCLAGACDRPPHRCRRACSLGNRNQAADDCKPKNAATGAPAEYCAPSDITKINSSLGSCALGDNCNPINQKVCQPGARPPYNDCCPSGFGCYPADRDATICIPEGSTQPGGERCELFNCKGGRNCTKGHLCTTQVDPQGRPVGNSKCNPMCVCNASCQAGLPTACPGGGGRSFCSPVRWTNGNVPVPVGVCVSL